MINRFKQSFIAPLEQKENKLWQYGFLAVLLIFLTFDIYRVQTRDNLSYNRFFITIGLLLNHLAFEFKFGVKVTILIRFLACSWLLIGLPYFILYN